MSSKVSSLRDIESGVNEFKCSDRVHDLLGLLRVGHQATTLRGAGHQSLLFLNFPCRVAGDNFLMSCHHVSPCNAIMSQIDFLDLDCDSGLLQLVEDGETKQNLKICNGRR